jgi:hypothetical protein
MLTRRSLCVLSTAAGLAAPYLAGSAARAARHWRSIAPGEMAVRKHFQARMPYGLFVPDLP